MAKPVFQARAEEEVFAERVAGDTWKTPQQITSRQISGKMYFTDQRIVFLASGLIGTASASWEIAMKDIQAVEACLTPPCFPFGIRITMKNGGQYKIGIMKRNKYIDWISQHIS